MSEALIREMKVKKITQVQNKQKIHSLSIQTFTYHNMELFFVSL